VEQGSQKASTVAYAKFLVCLIIRVWWPLSNDLKREWQHSCGFILTGAIVCSHLFAAVIDEK